MSFWERAARAGCVKRGLLAAASVAAAVRAMRKRATAVAEVGAQRTLFQEIIDASPAYIVAQDADGRYLLAPRSMAAGVGATVVGRTPQEVFGGETGERLADIHREVMLTGHPVHVEVPATSCDRSLSAVAFPLRHPDGSLRGAGGVAVDVTALHEANAALRRQEALLARTEEMARIGGWEWDPATGEVTWSDNMHALHGVRREDFTLGLDSFMELAHPDDRAGLSHLAEVALERHQESSVRYRIVGPDGQVRVLTSHATPILDEDGRPTRVSGFTRDVTELVTAEDEARAAERRYRELVDRLPLVLYIAGAEVHANWRFVSGQIEQLLGYTAVEWLADPTLWETLVHAEDRERVHRAEEAALSSGTLAVEYRMSTRDGRTIWVRDEAVARRGDGGELRLEGMLTNVTDRKAVETQLQHLADHDPLTGLRNRRRFASELAIESQLSARGTRPCAVVMLDLDNFKQVNDSLGHQAGDALIRAVADALAERLRASDTLTRLGGDEFAVLLRSTDLEQAMAVSGELLAAIRERLGSFRGDTVRITASAGVVASPAGGPEIGPEDLLAAADLAMYRAKQEGRDRVVSFSAELEHEVRLGFSWADRLRDALDHDRLHLFCQPIVDLTTGAVERSEILVRLEEENGTLVTPDAFMSAAERFGLVGEIDRWVLHHSVALMEERLAAGETIRLAVNVSGAAVGEPAFMAEVEEALERSEVDPADLTFEVTEAAAVADMDAARSFAERLGRLGCHFALDDVGSGFASFYYLRHLPMAYVKIDGLVVHGLGRNEVDEQIVAGMVGVARALGLATVAEHVGDEPTLQAARRLGVDYAQGFHLGVPRPAGDPELRLS
jgi:diguanylate cyclase (GGDEF)-like protein/PAS domain S-box-containing protein